VRALCEGCGRHQAAGWRAGDLCSFCGQAVRRDVRCYWCAKWVPAAKFCRSCGAAILDERLYGAARMLKDAGSDRFTIPRLLEEFDRDQIENFSRIYQRHAVAVARHVDEVRFLERFLRHQHWSGLLEDQLIPQLPWNEDLLARMSSPRPPQGDDLATVQGIQDSTPFGITRELAGLVRLRLDDWSSYPQAASAVYSADPEVRAEAALTLTGWRVWHRYGSPRDRDGAIVKELQASSYKVEAAVRLALLGRRDPDLLREALASSDRETSFSAALALGEVGRLQAALQGDPLERSAAGRKLIELGIIKPVVQIVEKSPLEVQKELVESLARRKEPAPEAADTLMEIIEKTDDATLRERAARVLCRDLRPEWVLRLARAAKEDRHIFQSLLQAPALDAQGAVALGDFLIQKGFFRIGQYGLKELAESGRMPESFVPSRFAPASGEAQDELLRFAEAQLGRVMSEGLHRFVLNVVFGSHPAKIRAGAWWVLHRSYRHHGEYRGEGPFKLEKGVIERFFGSVAAFLPKLASVLRDHATLKEVGYYEMIAHLLNSADDATVAAIQAEPSAADDLVEALLHGVGGDYWPNTVEGMMRLLSQIGSHPRWNERALAGLRTLNQRGNYSHDQAVRRLELAAHGLPEESVWSTLPDDWLVSRFEAARLEGQREMLRLAEVQLQARRGPALLRFLLRTAFQNGEPGIRLDAMRLYRERAASSRGLFILTRETAETYFDSLPALAPRLASVLREPRLTVDPQFAEFTSYLLHPNVAPEAFAVLASDDRGGHDLVRAALECLREGRGEKGLPESLILLLHHVGPDPRWRDEVLAALRPQQAALENRFGGPGERLMKRLEAPAPPPAKPEPAPPPQRPFVQACDGRGSDGPPPAPPAPPPRELSYEEKGRIAQEMGLELQRAIFVLMAGSKTPDEKIREAQRMSEEFQAKVKALYNP
jgi:hypothetical protein